MRIQRLTYQQLIELNRELGERGTVQNSNLEFVMETAKDIEDAADYAVTLLYEIPRAHSFSNGNKRTALFAFLEFMKLTGRRVRSSPEFESAMQRVLNEVAMGKATKNMVRRFVKSIFDNEAR